MQIDKFFLIDLALRLLATDRPAFFHSNNSNWGHSTRLIMLHTSPSVCKLYLSTSSGIDDEIPPPPPPVASPPTAVNNSVSYTTQNFFPELV